jgi:hypothetical protein
LKQFQSYWFSFWKIYGYARDHGYGVVAALQDAHRSRQKEKQCLIAMKARLETGVPGVLFGNPEFAHGLDYTQDRATSFAEILAENNIERCKQAIDNYLNLQQQLWSYGMHDKVYKIQDNYAVTEQGVAICIDFGEFTQEYGVAAERINSKRWLQRTSYKAWPEGPVKAYYTERMAEVMTVPNLEKHWGKSL